MNAIWDPMKNTTAATDSTINMITNAMAAKMPATIPVYPKVIEILLPFPRGSSNLLAIAIQTNATTTRMRRIAANQDEKLANKNFAKKSFKQTIINILLFDYNFINNTIDIIYIFCMKYQ